MNIAILGFGTIGSGVYEIIKNNISFNDINVVKVLDLPVNKDKLNIITSDIKDISEDPSIDLVVETMGGIHPAYEYIMECLNNKKHVVSANKAVIAAYYHDFIKTSKHNNVSFLFEASCGGGIPWLASILKAKRIDKINSFYGIFNGTSNFILDYMYKEEKSFNEVLSIAQSLGYAEANPSADIDGYDVSNKTYISSVLAFDGFIDMKEFPVYSLRNLTLNDISYFKNHHKVLKYIGEAFKQGNKYEAFVMLNLFDEDAIEANISKNFNIASLYGDTIGELKFYGQGAGKLPTANAIIQDIIDIKSKNTPYLKEDLNKLEYTDTLLMNKFIIRADELIEHEFIEKTDLYNDTYYYYTKCINTKQFIQLINIINNNCPDALFIKIANFK